MARAFKEPVNNGTLPSPAAESVSLQSSLSPLGRPAAVQGNNALIDIAQGLSSLNPALARMAEDRAQQDKDAAIAAARAQAAEDRVGKEKVAVAAPEAPNTVPWAVRDAWVKAYKDSMDNAYGAEAAAEMRKTFSEQYRNPDFNFSQFVGEFKRKEVTGSTDNFLTASIAKYLDAETDRLQNVYQEHAMRVTDETSRNLLAKDLEQITPAAGPESNWNVARAAIESAKGRGLLASEGARAVVDSVVATSTKLGGRPDLFDLFEQKDPTTGLTITQMNPALADNIARARKMAEGEWKQSLQKERYLTDELIRNDYRSRLDGGFFNAMTETQRYAWVAPNLGVDGAFNGEGVLARMMHEMREKAAQGNALAEGINLARSGALSQADEKVQRAVLDSQLQPQYGQLVKAIAGEADGGQAVQSMVNALTTFGASVPMEKLQSLVKSVELEVPRNSDVGPSPKFALVARLYSTMKTAGNDGMIHRHFGEDARALMENYLSAAQGDQMDNVTAYQAAFRSISPEAKRAAEDYFKDPSRASKIKKEARGAVASWASRAWSRLPFTDTIDSSLVESAAVQEAETYLKRFPYNSDKLADHIERWSAANFYREPETNTLIRVPPALNDPTTQSALSGYLADLTKAQGPDRSSRLVHTGGEQYDVVNTQPIYQKLATVSLSDLRRIHATKNSILPAEMETLADIKRKVIKGTANAADFEGNAKLLDKARMVGFWQETPEVVKARNKSSVEGAASKLYETMLKDSFKAKRGFVANQPLAFDSSLTRNVAQKFVDDGDMGGALTAMGEAVRLKVYDDPARGRNIGLGYNIDANASTVKDDFRRAGIPAEAVDAVLKGEAAITPTQAVRLFQAVQPRYAAMAEKAVEKIAPGEWERLPSNAKAVVTDMAYQMGNKVADFERGLTALVKGDLSGNNLKATYVNKAGQRVPDERRHALRVALLHSQTSFQTLLSHAAKQPANSYEALVATR